MMLTVLMVGGGALTAAAQQPDLTIAAATGCDVAAFTTARTAFEQLHTRRSFSPAAVTDDELRAASTAYVAVAEACYQALYGDATEHIDDGGVRFGVDGLQAGPFVTFGTKWGTGSPFTGGQDVPGSGTPGGTVTYSFMANGVSMAAETGVTPNVAIPNLPTYQACFIPRITSAFAAWTAIANIQFVQVADNGVAFNAAGATGDIRIGAHNFTGNTLAHGFYPPPNGATAAGDLHFDTGRPWGCAPAAGVYDIGLVALHEIGHAIGLNHEETRTAVMNPIYSASSAALYPDDINGGRAIYGPPSGPPLSSDDLVVDFGQSYGLWLLTDASAWSQLHTVSPVHIVTGDLDGNGVDDIVADFGSAGIWVRRNNAGWSKLNGGTTNRMATGDLDGNGRDELIVDFAGAGLWVWANDQSWFQLHSSSTGSIVTGDMDGNGKKEAIISFPGQGIWVWANNTSWSQLHSLNATAIIVGDVDGNGRADVVVSFSGAGVWLYRNNNTWSQVHSQNAPRLAAGDIDGNGRSDLIIDFGAGSGLWILANGATWSQLNAQTATGLTTGDLNGNGKADVIVNFGAAGLWTYADNSTWVQLQGLSPDEMAVGDINAP
jgi:hypothetical protein